MQSRTMQEAVLALKENVKRIRLQGNLRGYNLRGDVNDLASAIEVNKSLEELQIYRTNICLDNLKILCEALSKNTSIKTLCFWGSIMIGNRIQPLLHALTINQSISHLTLNNCVLRTQDVTDIATMLETNTRLDTLSLRANNISSNGAKLLANALKTNRTLRNLDIHLTSIKTEGICSLVTTLANNNSLTSLDIGGNSFQASAKKELLDALKINCSLITLGSNLLGSDQQLALEHLERNRQCPLHFAYEVETYKTTIHKQLWTLFLLHGLRPNSLIAILPFEMLFALFTYLVPSSFLNSNGNFAIEACERALLYAENYPAESKQANNENDAAFFKKFSLFVQQRVQNKDFALTNRPPTASLTT